MTLKYNGILKHAEKVTAENIDELKELYCRGGRKLLGSGIDEIKIGSILIAYRVRSDEFDMLVDENDPHITED